MDLGIDDDDIEEVLEVEALPMPGGNRLRDYQLRAKAAVRDGWKDYNRQLVVMATGTGKTVLFSSITSDEVLEATQREVKRGGRVLIIAHSEELLDQAADKLKATTGLESEREKAEDTASLSAKVVIASVQTLSKDDRLLGFSDMHFTLVIVDEAHRALARTYMKIICYFHFGEASLDEEWTMPEPGKPYVAHCRVLGFTATDDRGDRRSLGMLFQHCAFEYGLIDACRDGYLVRPIVKNLPLKVDIRGINPTGSDFGSKDLKAIGERLTPFLDEIAVNIAREAMDRKTIVFLPSIEAAERLAEACRGRGLNSWFVSGACADRADKIARFRAAGPGTLICNAMVLTEGFDAPDVSCVCVLRPTKIRGLFVQCAGRASRPLTGCIDGLETKEERLAAIAASAKPDMLILDFLWLTDRLDLIKPVDLVATRSDMKDRMQALADQAPTSDLLSLEAMAARDLLKSLAAAARKNANKAARVLDPLAWAVDLGDAKLATYEPETEFDRRAPTVGQLDYLKRQRFDITKVTCFGQANMIIGRMNSRFRLKLATPHQLHFLHQLVPDYKGSATMTEKECHDVIEILKVDPAARAAARAAISAKP